MNKRAKFHYIITAQYVIVMSYVQCLSIFPEVGSWLWPKHDVEILEKICLY
jgi:hypothetical protein